jgi:hypothetical protein
MADQPQRPSGATFTYVDLPEISETFADSVHMLSFDGQTLKIIFAVNRLESPQPQKPTTGKRHPACRLVLTAAGASELIEQVSKLGAAIAQGQVSATAQGQVSAAGRPERVS